ncbi:hypothetical protein GCM10010377_31200 [Streptomyces viridiviolaceus]|uniref:Uncharacterized protein n=1 Tax=Streptomyces viridiviolaceus TaxID=68282 RepID=A0ABW2E6U4_9ACTN|nr:hypothetical protein [Streptomyces viridiviolaceus]GHB37947.1 hypothetical protein GCM10010377_31200 [Streptomyces viridiviolaceus]
MRTFQRFVITTAATGLVVLGAGSAHAIGFGHAGADGSQYSVTIGLPEDAPQTRQAAEDGSGGIQQANEQQAQAAPGGVQQANIQQAQAAPGGVQQANIQQAQGLLGGLVQINMQQVQPASAPAAS